MRKIAVVALVMMLMIGLAMALWFKPIGPTMGIASQVDSNVHVAQVDTSHYPQVTLYVRVDDGNGNTRPGLLQKDFDVTEDGTPVDISAFQGSGGSQISTLLLMDRSGSMDLDDRLDGAKDAARTFVAQMRPTDQTALMAFSSDIQLMQPFTDNAELLDDAISDLEANGSTPLYDGMIAGINALQGQSGRRALLVLTDGRDCYGKPCADNPGSRATLDEAIARAKQAGLDVQVIGLGDRNSRRADDSIDEPVLKRIASETGGQYFYAPSADQLAALYASLGGSLHQEYALTYTSPRPSYDGTRRDIRVSVAGVTSAGGYTEQHLINVHSNTLVGIALLLPLLTALTAPVLLRRKGAQGAPVPADTSGMTPSALITPPALTPVLVGSSGTAPVVVPGAEATIAEPAQRSAAKRLQPEMLHKCTSCGSSLRPAARFCNTCGAAQMPPAPAAETVQRIFCDQCGKPILPGARFCDQCGAGVATGSAATEDAATEGLRLQGSR